ncbi:MAG TPA: hypothetical protein VFF03_13590 [Rhodocyclaceae bacterium]|nr:hypothetical protein [Rhodocyclaceae bacterium]
MKKLEILTLEQLQPGMRVAAPLLDEGGAVLLPAGVELSEGIIASLQRREVREVRVEFEVEDDPAAVERRRQLVKEQLDRRFRSAGEGAETKALYEAIAHYCLECRA